MLLLIISKMGKPFYRVSVLMAACLLSIQSVNAGGWLRSEGEHRYSAHLQGSSSDTSWDKDGNDVASSCTSNNRSLTHEYEYGYSYYRTFFGKVSMSSSECGADKVSGFSDVHLGVRGRLDLYSNGNAWEAILILPTGYDNERSNRLGYGEVGVDLGLYGANKVSKKTTLSYGGSLRFWAGPPSDQIRLKLGWSHKYSKLWAYNANIEGNFSLNNGDPSPIASIDGDFETEFDVIRVQLGVRRNLGQRLSLGGGFFTSVWGRDTSQRDGLYLNLSYVWGRL